MIGQLLADHVDPDAVAQITREALERVIDYPAVVGRLSPPTLERFGYPRGNGVALLDEFLRRSGAPEPQGPRRRGPRVMTEPAMPIRRHSARRSRIGSGRSLATGRRQLADLQRQFAYDRLLARLFGRRARRWVLKGATALLARLGGSARHTLDLDLYRPGAGLAEAEAALRAAAAADLDDFFRFALAPGRRMAEGRTTLRVPVDRLPRRHRVRRLPRRPHSRHRHDWRARRSAPLVPLDLPGIAAPDYRVYPIADHIADKLCALVEDAPARDRPAQASTRYRDLADLAVIAQTQPVDGDALRTALGVRGEPTGLCSRAGSPPRTRPAGGPATAGWPGTSRTSPSATSRLPLRRSGASSTRCWGARPPAAGIRSASAGRRDALRCRSVAAGQPHHDPGRAHPASSGAMRHRAPMFRLRLHLLAAAVIAVGLVVTGCREHSEPSTEQQMRDLGLPLDILATIDPRTQVTVRSTDGVRELLIFSYYHFGGTELGIIPATRPTVNGGMVGDASSLGMPAGRGIEPAHQVLFGAGQGPLTRVETDEPEAWTELVNPDVDGWLITVPETVGADYISWRLIGNDGALLYESAGIGMPDFGLAVDEQTSCSSGSATAPPSSLSTRRTPSAALTSQSPTPTRRRSTAVSPARPPAPATGTCSAPARGRCACSRASAPCRPPATRLSMPPTGAG